MDSIPTDTTNYRILENVLVIIKRRVEIAKLLREASELGVVVQPEELEMLKRLSESHWFPFRYNN